MFSVKKWAVYTELNEQVLSELNPLNSFPEEKATLVYSKHCCCCYVRGALQCSALVLWVEAPQAHRSLIAASPEHQTSAIAWGHSLTARGP